MMYSAKRKITKEQYDRAKANHGYLTSEDERAVFSESELLGYGIYGAVAFMENGEYYVRYTTSDSCD